jgi:hypothetical protein
MIIKRTEKVEYAQSGEITFFFCFIIYDIFSINIQSAGINYDIIIVKI